MRRSRSLMLLVSAALVMPTAGCQLPQTELRKTPLPHVTADPQLAAKVPAEIRTSGQLKLGTHPPYPPAEFFDYDGTTIVGFDIDLGNAIAARLGLNATWQASDFQTLIESVIDGKFQAAMSGITISAAREARTNMISYLQSGTEWAVATGNPYGITPDTACGRSVAVQMSTVQVTDVQARSDKCVADGQPPITIEQYQDSATAATSAVIGKDDALVGDSPVVEYAIARTAKLQQTGSIYASAPFGIVLAKDQGQLAQVVLQALQSLIADGSYKAILNAWGVTQGLVATPQLNPSEPAG